MGSSPKFNEKDVGFIGEDLVLEGTVHSRNKLVIHGTIKGVISGEDEITIGKSGNVHGSISGGLVTVAGKVEGDMNIQDHLEISPTGNIEGEIRVPPGKLVIHEGAEISGQCFITSSDKKSISSKS